MHPLGGSSPSKTAMYNTFIKALKIFYKNIVTTYLQSSNIYISEITSSV